MGQTKRSEDLGASSCLLVPHWLENHGYRGLWGFFSAWIVHRTCRRRGKAVLEVILPPGYLQLVCLGQSTKYILLHLSIFWEGEQVCYWLSKPSIFWKMQGFGIHSDSCIHALLNQMTTKCMFPPDAVIEGCSLLNSPTTSLCKEAEWVISYLLL